MKPEAPAHCRCFLCWPPGDRFREFFVCGKKAYDCNGKPFISYRSGRWKSAVPEISRFYGIVIRMQYREHPPPHFHAYYGKQKVSIEIGSGSVRGEMSKRALRLIWDWLELHEDELAENWQRALERKPLNDIEPLP